MATLRESVLIGVAAHAGEIEHSTVNTKRNNPKKRIILEGFMVTPN